MPGANLRGEKVFPNEIPEINGFLCAHNGADNLWLAVDAGQSSSWNGYSAASEAATYSIQSQVARGTGPFLSILPPTFEIRTGYDLPGRGEMHAMPRNHQYGKPKH